MSAAAADANMLLGPIDPAASGVALLAKGVVLVLTLPVGTT